MADVVDTIFAGLRGGGQNGAPLYLRLRRKENHRIKIALNRHVVSDGRPRVIYLYPPIYTKHIRAGLMHERQERSRAGSKVNQRNPFAL